MKRKVTVLVAVVALVLIASRCDNASSGSPYFSGQYGSAMKASTGHARSDTENDAPTEKE